MINNLHWICSMVKWVTIFHPPNSNQILKWPIFVDLVARSGCPRGGSAAEPKEGGYGCCQGGTATTMVPRRYWFNELKLKQVNTILKLYRKDLDITFFPLPGCCLPTIFELTGTTSGTLFYERSKGTMAINHQEDTRSKVGWSGTFIDKNIKDVE